MAYATHATLSSDLALVLRRLGGVLLSACVVVLTLHLSCTHSSFSVVVHPSVLHLVPLLYLSIRAQSQKMMLTNLDNDVSTSAANKKHEELPADGGYNFTSLQNLVHLPIPFPEAMNIPKQRWQWTRNRDIFRKKKTQLPAPQVSKVRNKKGVIEEAHKKAKQFILQRFIGL